MTMMSLLRVMMVRRKARLCVSVGLCCFLFAGLRLLSLAGTRMETTPTLLVEAATDVPVSDVEGLFALLNDVPANFVWINERIRRLWPGWLSAYNALAVKYRRPLHLQPRKRVLLHLGLLTKGSGFKIAEKASHGGPLGELVQWADLLASLYILRHHLVVTSEMQSLDGYLSDCSSVTQLDVIYTDIVGMKQLSRKIGKCLPHFRCRLRVLDSFGTQAEFNDNTYFNDHKSSLGGSGNAWGGLGLNLQQFYTMFPHSPDNTFLGFVIEIHNSASSSDGNEQKDIALLYAKEAYMIKGAESFLKTISDLVTLHATIDKKLSDHSAAKPKEAEVPIPSFIHNHGVLVAEDYQALLRRVKVFVGVGFPYEGPAPLEALANGAVFINPRFATPKGRLNDKFFAGKPTLRALSSQNPYAEQMVGPPYVLTIDMHNDTAVRHAVRTALLTNTHAAHLPYEFTAEGMLERVNALLQLQDACTEERQWPPFAANKPIVGQHGESCQDACWRQGLVCEPSYFKRLNEIEAIERLSSRCESVSLVADVYAPSVSDAAHCTVQVNRLLFSCAASAPTSQRRVCGCRDFINEQMFGRLLPVERQALRHKRMGVPVLADWQDVAASPFRYTLRGRPDADDEEFREELWLLHVSVAPPFLLFATNRQLDAIQQAEILVADGTFKTAPTDWCRSTPSTPRLTASPCLSASCSFAPSSGRCTRRPSADCVES